MTTTAITSPLFQALPTVLNTVIVPFCDDQAILQMLKVCQAWNKNVDIQKAKATAHANWENRWGTQEGYPLQLLSVFRHCGFPIFRLPELSFEAVNSQDFQQRMNKNRRAGKDALHEIHGIGVRGDGTPFIDNDYIDFLSQHHLQAPIMRFKDCQNRVGIVMCLQNHRLFNVTGLCTIFRRRAGSGDLNEWVPAPFQHNDLSLFSSQVRGEDGYVVFDALIPLLSGTHSHYKIINPPQPPPAPPDPPQAPAINQPPTPPNPPQALAMDNPPPPLDPPQTQSSIRRCISWLISCLHTAICDFFSWLCSCCGSTRDQPK